MFVGVLTKAEVRECVSVRSCLQRKAQQRHRLWQRSRDTKQRSHLNVISCTRQSASTLCAHADLMISTPARFSPPSFSNKSPKLDDMAWYFIWTRLKCDYISGVYLPGFSQIPAWGDNAMIIIVRFMWVRSAKGEEAIWISIILAVLTACERFVMQVVCYVVICHNFLLFCNFLLRSRHNYCCHVS